MNVLRKAKTNESGEGDTQQSMQIASKTEAPKARRLQMWSGSMYILYRNRIKGQDFSIL